MDERTEREIFMLKQLISQKEYELRVFIEQLKEIVDKLSSPIDKDGLYLQDEVQ
jgi:hypothetical protein